MFQCGAAESALDGINLILAFTNGAEEPLDIFHIFFVFLFNVKVRVKGPIYGNSNSSYIIFPPIRLEIHSSVLL
jgi:hypothetical protein